MVWHAIRLVLWVIFALSAKAHAGPLDGVYFEASPAWGVALQIAEGRVTYTRRYPRRPDASGPTSVGSITVDADRLHLTHPEHGSMATTWAIIDGELWTNVLRRTPAAPNVWRSHLTYQPARQSDQQGPEIVWDLGQGTLSFAWHSTNIRFDQVGLFRPLASDRTAVVPWHASNKSIQAIPSNTAHRIEHCSSANTGGKICHYGLFAPSAKPDPAWSQPSMRYRLWRQVGDTMLTPWSRRWGLVGLVPDRMRQPKPGRWVGANLLRSPTRHTELWRAPEAHLSIVKAPKKAPPETPRQSLFLAGTPQPKHHVYRPDAQGLTVSFFGQDCMQGHGDWMGHVIWFSMADGRVVLRKAPASHDNFPPGTFILSRVVTP